VQERLPEDREVVTFDTIEELYSEPVELIGADLMDLRAGGSKVSAEELWENDRIVRCAVSM
jgi:hypothetical protein